MNNLEGMRMNNKSIPTGICSNSSSEVFMNLIGRNIPCVFHDKTSNYCFNPNNCKRKQKINSFILENNDEKNI